jgi:hypothetical protein
MRRSFAEFILSGQGEILRCFENAFHGFRVPLAAWGTAMKIAAMDV